MDPSSLGPFEGLYDNFVNFYQIRGPLEGTLILIILVLSMIYMAKNWREHLVVKIFVYVFVGFMALWTIMLILAMITTAIAG